MDILITHEPGGTYLADKIRTLFLSEGAKNASAETQFGLVWAARADHMANKIIPALKNGTSVLCDRFDSSTYAYQVHAGCAPNLEKLFWKTRDGFLGKYKPDLYIFLDVDPKTGLERINRRGGAKTNFDSRNLAFHKEVSAGFIKFFKHVPHRVLDASRSFERVAADFADLIKHVV